MIAEYFLSLDPLALLRAMPGTAAQGIIWGIMALGVYITFRILDFPDLTVDGSLATGAATAVMLIQGGMSPALSLVFSLLAGMAAVIAITIRIAAAFFHFISYSSLLLLYFKNFSLHCTKVIYES